MNAVATPRKKTFFSRVRGRAKRGLEERRRVGKEEKDACIQIRGLAELMGTRRGAFFCKREGGKKKSFA